MINTGIKIYMDDNSNDRQKYLLVEARLENSMFKNYSKFKSTELDFLLQSQAITMMNMIPVKDIRHSIELFADEEYDFLAPLEIFKSNSLCNYMLNR